jgi:hypothetical protein
MDAPMMKAALTGLLIISPVGWQVRKHPLFCNLLQSSREIASGEAAPVVENGRSGSIDSRLVLKRGKEPRWAGVL